ncbi:hypothetical protein SDC9_186761 [bioreactor metagenome]|uniref:Uncharacterized protein n=1 Tax=bioreactor metagenome TaxID=1076179 RepID=A0A645HV36_9ZZZZ
MDHVRLRQRLEILTRQMRRAAVAERRIGKPAGLALGLRNQFGDAARLQRRLDDQQQGLRCHQRDGLERLDRVIAQVGIDMRSNR